MLCDGHKKAPAVRPGLWGHEAVNVENPRYEKTYNNGSHLSIHSVVFMIQSVVSGGNVYRLWF